MTSLRKITIIAMFAALISYFNTEALNYQPCDQDKVLSAIKSITVSDCNEDVDPCIFHRGTNKTIELVFTPKQTIDSVKVKIVGRLGKADLPFHIEPDDACSNYGFDCPLEAGKDYTFNLSMPILGIYPKIKVGVFLRLLTNNNNSVITCVNIPAKIE